MSYAYANAGTLFRPYYMDPDCPDYLKPAQWTQGCCQPNSIFNNGYGCGYDYGYGYSMGPAPMCGYGVDGCNDGRISFGTKAISFTKGIFKPITNMFSSPKNLLMGALCIGAGAALIAATGGAAAPLLVALGAVGGGIKVAKGAIGAASAQTDAEAIAAWENMGEGTGILAGSILGSKAALKKANPSMDTSKMSYLQATKKCFSGSKQYATNSWKTASGKFTGLFSKNGTTATPIKVPKVKHKVVETPSTPNAQGGTSTGSSTPVDNINRVYHYNAERYINSGGAPKYAVGRVTINGSNGSSISGTGSISAVAEVSAYKNGNILYRSLSPEAKAIISGH